MNTPANTLLPRLLQVRQLQPNCWQALCPAHDDKKPSLSIQQNPDNRLLIHCHAGCGAAEVLEAIGLQFKDLFPAEKQKNYDGVTSRQKVYRLDSSLALHGLKTEMTAISIIAEDMTAGKAIDWERLSLVQTRINNVIRVVGDPVVKRRIT